MNTRTVAPGATAEDEALEAVAEDALVLDAAAPRLPREVIEKTAAKYQEALTRLMG